MARQLILITENELPKAGVWGRDKPLSAYRKALGTTQQDLFYSAANGLFPNAFAALAGSIADAHHYYLYLPENYPQGDPDHQRYADYGEDIRLCHDYFNARLKRIAATPIADTHADKTDVPLPAAFFDLPQTLLLGARGRGKSTALAEKIQRLSARGCTPILVVTPFADNHAIISALPQNVLQNILFLPPDAALEKLPAAQHLIIDEAAALAPQQLLALTAHYPHWSLATTTDGYEGSANQFRVNVLPQLPLPTEAIFSLQTAYRYCGKDALEQTLHRIFLSQPETREITIPQDAPLNICELSQASLFQEETLLARLWHLLSEAHYRTRPDDLKRLLDMPQQRLWVASAGGEILGVLQVLIETPLPASLAAEIIAGKRRPQGRLLMQQLLMHTQQPAWANAHLARISRIAVHKNHRRRGIASALIQEAQHALPLRFGTTYAATPRLDAFWNALGFQEMWRADYTRSRNMAPTSLRVAYAQ